MTDVTANCLARERPGSTGGGMVVRGDGRATRPVWARTLVGLGLLALVAGACGDDDDDDDADGTATTGVAAGSTTGGDTATTGESGEGEPTVGGEAQILWYNEVATVDPHKETTSGGSSGNRLFPFYGALMTYTAEANDVEMFMAESFEPSADFSTWTLTLRDGIMFSDGTPYDAAAVQTNWERIADPATGSPSIGVMLGVAEMTVVDDVTLEVTLTAPNAHFDKQVSAQNLNYIISPQAIADGVDLSNEVVGAGPYLLDNWARDDRMVMVRNPTYWDSPRPYLDQITLRVVVVDDQRIDTFATDETVNATWQFGQVQLDAAAEQRDGTVHGVVTNNSPALTMNNSAPPFDDPRVRRAAVLGLDREAFVAVVYEEGTPFATNFADSSSPWYSEAGELPDYDPEAAQALFDEVAEEQGGPVEFTFLGTQNDPGRGEFVQTSMNQFDNVDVELTAADSATHIGSTVQGDYQMSTWGFPYLDPDPGLYRYVHSTQFTNFAHYVNPEVDALMDEARLIDDDEERYGLYEQVYAHLAEDLPWIPYHNQISGFAVAPGLEGVSLYEDSILRVDLLHVTG